MRSKRELYGGVVWILSAVFLTVYGTLGVLNTPVPGVEELVRFLGTVDGRYLSFGAFLAIFIEGLYFVGSFFPGTTLVTLLALFSQVGGSTTFFMTIVMIFIGWSLSSVVNITLARTYQAKVNHQAVDDQFVIKDHLFTTWFPAFRANYEVAQVAEGAPPLAVLRSSLKVKLLACVAAGAGAFLVPYVIDIHSLSNEEGFVSLAVVATISMVIGVRKLRAYRRGR